MTKAFALTGGMANSAWDEDELIHKFVTTSGDPTIAARGEWIAEHGGRYRTILGQEQLHRDADRFMFLTPAHIYVLFDNETTAVEYRLVFSDEPISIPD